ncbi:MAG: serine hydrolase [Bdellovibrionales bacterium]|nr:serine hydrolase [Bdellovibrionales bacterium]
MKLTRLVLLASCIGLSSSASRACDTGGEFRRAIEAVLGAHGSQQGSFQLTILRAGNGQVLCDEKLNADKSVYPASTIKTLVAISIFRKIDRRELTLDQRVQMNQPNAAAECSDWGCNRYGPGKFLTIGEMLTDMLTVSNNLATNQLIDVATKDFINRTADDLSAPSLRVHHKVYSHQDPEPNISLRNLATAAGHAQVYKLLAVGAPAVFSESSRMQILKILEGQRDNDRLNGQFPKGVMFYHKPGNTSKVTGDAGFYQLDAHTIVVIAALQDFANITTPDGKNTSGYTTLQRIGRRTYDLVPGVTRGSFRSSSAP